MQKKLAFALLLISSISLAKAPKLEEIKNQLKNEKHVLERDKALDDLKKAGIAGTSALAGAGVYYVAMNTFGLAKAAFMETKIASLPIVTWTFIVWAFAEIGTVGYAAVKAGQGAKHLMLPDHEIVVSKVDGTIKTKENPTTHIRVKRENG